MGRPKIYSPYVAMVLVQLAYGGSNILMKIALYRGLNQFVFVVYRHLIATLLLGPFAYLLERKERPPLSLKIALKIFVLSSLGTTIHLNMYYAGLTYTSATLGSAMSNLIPCLTFLIAFLLGMEKVGMKSLSGRAKVVGTLICVCGSLTFTFWKGSCLEKGLARRPLISMYGGNGSSSLMKVHIVEENWVKGSALIMMSDVAWSAWLILQAFVFKDYPAPYSLNTIICFFASLQSSVIALFFARDPSLWKFEWNVQLWTILYCGVVISAGVYSLQTWIISHRGPVFAAMFSPLQLVIVGIFSVVALAEQLHFGSLIGACLIITGLYFVLWGKRKEHDLAAESIYMVNNVNNNTQELEITIQGYQPDAEKLQDK